LSAVMEMILQIHVCTTKLTSDARYSKPRPTAGHCHTANLVM